MDDRTTCGTPYVVWSAFSAVCSEDKEVIFVSDNNLGSQQRRGDLH